MGNSKNRRDVPSNTKPEKKSGTLIVGNFSNDPGSDPLIAAEVAAAMAPPPPQPKRAKDVPMPRLNTVIGNSLVFQGMLQQCWMLLRTLDLSVLEELHLRDRTGAFWVHLNEDTDKRYAILAKLAERTEEPVLMVDDDFRPETITEAAVRHLRLLHERKFARFSEALEDAAVSGLVDSRAIKEFIKT